MPSARRSRWPTSSPGSGPVPAARPLRYNPARNVEDLRNLWEEAVVRQPSLTLDGRLEAALGPEPPAGSDPPQGLPSARLRLHALPQGQQSRQSGLAPPSNRSSGI